MRAAGRLALGAMLVLAACARRPPPPTPPAVRPPVTCATIRLRTPADLDAHGDVVIPRDVVVSLGGLPGVFILSPRGRARFRLIKIGATTAQTAQILSGLDGHETLIRPPRHGGIYDGTPVRPLITATRGPHGRR
ncbi:hypothetical protein [Acidiferrobacter sp.]|uniref:hypothetical protein n=1 Tax=Acidiferrobacter sp. TaxID=1872107 RepID=UPI00261378F7|nr:hypothetical protein [Acidiferrobacter sp.]